MTNRYKLRFYQVFFWLFLIGSILVEVMIFYFSAQNAAASQELSNGLLDTVVGMLVENLPELSHTGVTGSIRKYGHISEFFGLGICLSGMVCCFLSRKKPEMKRGQFFLTSIAGSFAIGFLSACSDEFHQLFVPGRAGRLQDVLFFDSPGNLAGILVMTVLFVLIAKKKTKK